MAYFYYVKSGGTAASGSGRYATAKTGSWSTEFTATSQYYDSIEAALEDATNPPADGDVICVSDAHSKSYSSTRYLDSSASDLLIVCVEDGDVDVESTGASETNSSATYIRFDDEGSVVIRGVDITSSNRIAFLGPNANIRWYNSTVGRDSTTSQNTIELGTDGVFLELNDCTLPVGNAASLHRILTLGYGCHFVMNGGSIIDDGLNQPNALVRATTNGGGIAEFNGVDLTNMASGFEIIESVSQTYDDGMNITLNNCKLPASWTFGTNYSPHNFVKVINCDDGTSNIIQGESTGTGSFLTNTSNYRNGSLDGTSVSHGVTTTSRVFAGGPHYKYKLATVWYDFTSGGTITVDAIHDDQFGSSARSDDTQIWIEALVPNASDPGRTRYSTRATNYFAPTTNTAGTASEWTETLTTEVAEEYSITVPPGKGEGFVDVFICIAEPSITVYVDPAVGIA